LLYSLSTGTQGNRGGSPSPRRSALPNAISNHFHAHFRAPQYYRSWKDQDNDISDVCASLDSLQRTLTILSKTIQPPARFDMGIKDSVEKNVNCINGALEKLTDELRKVQGTELLKSGARSAMRRHVRRALYPFREETLSNIQRVVSEARSNLDLALQVLQVFVYLRFISNVLQRLG
jgi:hypothetical protein